MSMKINHKVSFAVIAVAFAVVAVLLLNMAFAATSSVQSEGNNMDADVRSVDITLDDGTTLSTSLKITPPDYATVTNPLGVHYATIDGHVLNVTSSDDVLVRAWMVLSSTSSWLIVDSASIYMGATTAEIQSNNTLYLDDGTTATAENKAAALYILNDNGEYNQATGTQITTSKILYTDAGCTSPASVADIGDTETTLYVQGGVTATDNDRKAAVYHYEGTDTYTQAQAGQRTGVETLYSLKNFAITPAHDQSNRSAGTPTAAFELPEGSYPFIVKVTFTAQYDTKDYNGTITTETMSETMYNTLRSAFSGQLVFAIGDDDPLPQIQAQNP